MYVTNNASFSECRTYRYSLWRSWMQFLPAADNYVNFIMLNPSTADESTDDRTIKKCVKFAKSWGYYGLCVTNIFAYRSTDPKVMKRVGDPIGPENNAYIEELAANAKLVVAAWSGHGSHLARSASVKLLLRGTPLHYLRIGKTGEPYHPLYLPDNSKPVFWYQ